MRRAAADWIDALHRLDLGATAGSNRANRLGPCRVVFAWASRLGDGWFWYALAAALLLVEGRAALPAVLAMAGAGLVGSGLYALIKHATRRTRPCHRHGGLTLTVAPLDRFSFPSGHTLHAVAFSVIAVAHAPALAWVVWPFAALVAASRLVLGLHYPTDVIAGGALGAVLAWAALALAAACGASA